MTSQVLKETGSIKKLYHISDLHIRNVHRHEEYRQVFSNLLSWLKDSDPGLIVITGDIMHTKTELSPESFSLASNLLENLCKIHPVILIPGNHDCNLSNKQRMDALSPIVESLGNENLYYLRESGFFRYGNIVFGHSSILGEFLPRDGSSVVGGIIHVALYHGPVHKSVTDVGYRMNHKERLAQDFDGYDYVLLGDIHKYQYLNEEKTIAYAGSLIQQDFGEKLSHHGVLVWDLAKKTSHHVSVPNDYGFVNLPIVNGTLPDAILPKFSRIKFILKNTSPDQYTSLLSQIKTRTKILEEIVENDSVSQFINTCDITDVIDDVKRISEDELLDKYLSCHPMARELRDLHLELLGQKILPADMGSSICHLERLEFSNMFSYGEDTVIDFTSYPSREMIGIVAPNRHGKSAILDVILFTLFDRNPRGDRACVMRLDAQRLRSSLWFSIGDLKYLIERRGHRTPKNVKIDVSFYQLVETDDGIKRRPLSGIDRNDTNRKIQDLVGTYASLTSTSFWMSDVSPPSFLEMTCAQRKDYLSTTFKLENYQELFAHAKGEISSLKKLCQVLETRSRDVEEIYEKHRHQSLEIQMLCERREKYQHLLCLVPQVNLPQRPELSIWAKYPNKSISQIAKILEKKREWLEETHLTGTQDASCELQDLRTQHDSYLAQIEDIEISLGELVQKFLPSNKHLKCSSNALDEYVDYDWEDVKSKLADSQPPLPEKISDPLPDILTIWENMQRRKYDPHHECRLEERDDFCQFLQTLPPNEQIDDWMSWYHSWKSLVKKECTDASQMDWIVQLSLKINKLSRYGASLVIRSRRYGWQKEWDLVQDQLKLGEMVRESEVRRHNDKLSTMIDNRRSEKKSLEEKVRDLDARISDLCYRMDNYSQIAATWEEESAEMLIARSWSNTRDIMESMKEDNETRRKSIEREIERITGSIHRLEISCENTRVKLDIANEARDEYRAAKDKLGLYLQYSKMVSPSGIPYQILKRALPQIQEAINNILQYLVDFRVKLEYPEKIMDGDIHVMLCFGNKSLPIKSGSGLEKFIAYLATRVAFRNISSGPKLDILAMDEVWKSIDQDNMSRMPEVMAKISSYYQHVLIISHDPTLKNMCHHNIQVCRKYDVSYLE